jgi:hypothetical protein
VEPRTILSAHVSIAPVERVTIRLLVLGFDAATQISDIFVVVRVCLCIALIGFVAACSAPVCNEPVDGRPEQRRCSDGAIERVGSATCAATTCSFKPNAAGGGPCEASFDCVAEANTSEGFCVDGNCVCDECLLDQDCDSREFCACTFGADVGKVGAGCLVGCRTSGDCKESERCIQVLDSPSFACQALDSPCRTTRDCWWPSDRCIPSEFTSSSWTCTSKIPIVVP